MSKKPTSKKGATAAVVEEEHDLYPMTPEFVRQMLPYLNSSDKIPVKYVAWLADFSNGKEGEKISFECTKLVPRAAAERARECQTKFEYDFAHAIAFPYEQEMLACGSFICEGCAGPATRIMQMPVMNWDEDPPTIRDFLSAVCGHPNCVRKAQDFTMKFLNERKEKTGMLRAVGESRMCEECGVIGNVKVDLSKCSRCKKAYYCGKKCQLKAWPKHKKACRAPSSS